jgi:hypothetical protein
LFSGLEAATLSAALNRRAIFLLLIAVKVRIMDFNLDSISPKTSGFLDKVKFGFEVLVNSGYIF